MTRTTLRLVGFVAVTLALAIVAADARAQAPQPQSAIPLSADSKPAPYTVAAGDTIKLEFFNLIGADADMRQDYLVQDNGAIRLKYVGDLNVTGMTTEDIQDAVYKVLVPKYYQEGVISVTATVTEQRLQEVTVNGYVTRPGLQRLRGAEMFVGHAINAAGNFSADAGEEIEVRRVTADGKTVLFEKTRTQIQAGDDMPLQAGDHVVVKKGEFFSVNGEVNNSGQKRWLPGMTVLQAVAAAGGMTNKGKYGHIERPVKDEDGNLIKYEKVKDLKNETPILAGDVLIIARKWFGG
jgi:polysaccharide export outer membrane protein